MKKTAIILIAVICVAQSFGQFDRQDMVSLKTKKVDASYIGKLVRLDFLKNTTGVNDTVVLVINNNPVQFINKQADNVQSNFYSQYLESVANSDGYAIRLEKTRIDAVTEDSIQVTNYFSFYSKGNVLAAGKSLQQQYWFSKKMINRVLVKEGKKGI